jgi:hypothetical protein
MFDFLPNYIDSPYYKQLNITSNHIFYVSSCVTFIVQIQKWQETASVFVDLR